MNWYKQAQLKVKVAARTLYHGTSRDKLKSIQELGLIPQVGHFVLWGYDEYEDAGIELPELVFATDKGELDKAHTAMVQSVGNMLGKGYHKVTAEETIAYGVLAIIPGEPGGPEGAQGFQRRRPREEVGAGYDEEWDRFYQNDYPTVEPGDYFSEGGAWPIKILTGNKMMKFFARHLGRRFPYDMEKIPKDRLKKLILEKAIEKELEKNPEADREFLMEDGSRKLDAATDEELKAYYKAYVRP